MALSDQKISSTFLDLKVKSTFDPPEVEIFRKKGLKITIRAHVLTKKVKMEDFKFSEISLSYQSRFEV